MSKNDITFVFGTVILFTFEFSMLSINILENFMLPCLNKQLFGIDCLGCGAQRAAVLLFQGEFFLAFKLYPAIYSIVLLAFFLLFDLFVKIRYAYKIKMGLVIFTASIMVISYLIKIIN